MKKILAVLVFTLLAVTLRAQGSTYSPVCSFFFLSPGTEYSVTNENDESVKCTAEAIKYDDGTPLVENESVRVLAVFPDAPLANPEELPFTLKTDCEPQLTVSGSCQWMNITVDSNGGTSTQTYAPVDASIPGIPYGLAYDLGYVIYREVRGTLNNIPYTTTCYVYLVTLDTRDSDGKVVAGAPTNLVKWNAVYAARFSIMPQPQYVSVNFLKSPYSSITALTSGGTSLSLEALSPTRLPYGVEAEPEITFPEDANEADEEPAIAAVEAALGSLNGVKHIANPAVGAAINGIITGSGTVTVKDGVAEFAYTFKVSKITFGESGVTVTVELGTNQEFADDAKVSLVDLNGEAVSGTVDYSIAKDGKTATVTLEIDEGTQGTYLFKVKAEKADQTIEEAVEWD